MKAWMCIVFLAAGPIMFADTVTSVVCNVEGLPTVTDPNHCSLTRAGLFGDDGTADATVSANLSLASNPSGFSTLVTNLNAIASPFIPNGIPTDNFGTCAGSLATVNQALFTTGNQRSGYMQISAGGGYSRDVRNGSADMELSLGPVQLFCVGVNPAGSSTCVLVPDPQRDPPRYIIPPYPQNANSL